MKLPKRVHIKGDVGDWRWLHVVDADDPDNKLCVVSMNISVAIDSVTTVELVLLDKKPGGMTTHLDHTCEVVEAPKHTGGVVNYATGVLGIDLGNLPSTMVRRAVELVRNPCVEVPIGKHERATCPDCKGTGEYRGFTQVDRCTSCNGSGQI